MKKIIGLVLSILLVAGGTAYFGLSYMLYQQLAAVEPRCPTHVANTPASFIVHSSDWANFDTAPYRMPRYDEVRFASRQPTGSTRGQPGLMLVGWYVEADPHAPTVILTHGLNACKHDHSILIPAGMLHRAGFNVLMFDLRDQGFSDVEDGRTAIGNEEYLDLLGAWDWLVETKGIAPERIGLFGVSLGAATTLAAFAEEPRTAAAFVDSPFADLSQVIAEELTRNNFPTLLAPGGIWVARVVSGDDLLAHSPLEAIRRHADRPLFIVHGDADQLVDQHHTRDLAALAQQTGARLTTWLPTGIGHVEAMLAMPDDYEQRLIGFFREALER